MVFKTWDLILLSVEIVVYTFHLSMLILLYLKRMKEFDSPFYRVLRIILFGDLLAFATTFVAVRIPESGLISKTFFQNNGYLASIVYNTSSYLTALQFLGHTMLAFNRFTLLWFPLKHFFIWKRQWYTFALIGLPFLHVCWRLHEPGVFGFTATDSVTISFVNPKVLPIIYSVSSTIYISTTCLGAIFNFLSLIKFCFYKHLSATNSNSNEKNLLFVAFIIFFSQVLRTSYGIIRPMFTNDNPIIPFLIAILPLINDIFAWACSISLLILSSTSRKEYLKFYGCKNVHSQHIVASSSYPMVL